MKKNNSPVVISSDKRNTILVVILAIVIIIAILFWKTESFSDKLEEAQIKVFKLNNDVTTKITEIDSLHAQNRMLTQEYEALRNNYIRLQRIIIQKRNAMADLPENIEKEEITSFVDELNQQIMAYEEVFSDLNQLTESSISDEESRRILEENALLEKKLKASELEKELLRRQKALVDQRIAQLENEIAQLNENNTTYTASIAHLQTELSEKEETVNQIAEEKDSIEQAKNQRIASLNQQVDMIDDFIEESFSATYKYKEGRRKQITTQLNDTEVHKARFVETVDIQFVVKQQPSSNNPDNMAYLTVFKKNGQNEYVPYRYENIGIKVVEHQANYQLNVEPQFDEGNYEFRVRYNSAVIYIYKFSIDAGFLF